MDKIFKKNSKTFSFASIFFPDYIHQEITNIYAFFRFSDDFSDDPLNNPDYDATIEFGKLLSVFRNEKECKRWLQKKISKKIVQKSYLNYFEYGKKFKVPNKYMELIFNGYEMDKEMDLSDNHQIKSIDDLIRYSFYVAGSVAVILAYTIKHRYNLDNKTLSQFSAIAIGYQLTNISRDIITDAKMKRCYIPWMTSEHKKKLFRNELSNSIILEYSKKMVELADAYYKYGIPILNKIPSEIGNGLKITTRIYREIGLKIYKREIYHERMYTTEWEKITLLLNTNNKPFVGNQLMPLNPTKYLLECVNINDNKVYNTYLNSNDSDQELSDSNEEISDSDEEINSDEESNDIDIRSKKQNKNVSKKHIFILLIFTLIVINKFHNTIKKHFVKIDKKNIVEEKIFIEG